MSLKNFRLSPEQKHVEFVTVLADVGSERVIGEIDRDFITDRARSNLSDDQRIDFVRQHLLTFERMVAEKYDRGDFTRCARGGDQNVLVRIGT